MASFKSLTRALLKQILNLAIGEAAESVETICAEVGADPTLVTDRAKRTKARRLLDGEIERVKAEAPEHLRNLAVEVGVALLKR